MLKSIHPFDQSVVDEFQEIDSSVFKRNWIKLQPLLKIGRKHRLLTAVN